MANENLSILKRIVAQVKEPAPRLDSVEKRITALREVVKLLDAQVSKEDFVKAFESLLAYFKDLRAANQAEIAEMRARSEAFFADVKKAQDADIKALSAEVEDVLTEQATAIAAKLKAADQVIAQVAKLRDGKQGPKGDKGDPGAKGDSGTAGSPDTAEDIRNKLELLTGEDRLDSSAIRGLDTLMTDTQTVISGGLTRMKTDSLYTKFVGGASTITVSATEPTNPQLYDLWVDIS